MGQLFISPGLSGGEYLEDISNRYWAWKMKEFQVKGKGHRSLVKVIRSKTFFIFAGLSGGEYLEDISNRYWAWKMKEFPTFATVQKVYSYDDIVEDFSFQAFDRRKVQ